MSSNMGRVYSTMIPEHLLSTTVVQADFLFPDSLERSDLVDYELGGIALSDPSQGLEVQRWTLTYVDPDIIITPDSGGDNVAFSIAGITEASLAFDQNMHPFIAYVVAGESWYWWFDPFTAGQEHVQMATGILTPRCCLDDKRASQTDSSDVILAYIRIGNLYYREQRDRYAIEYLLAAGTPYQLSRIGMNIKIRLQFEYIFPLETSGGEGDFGF